MKRTKKKFLPKLCLLHRRIDVNKAHVFAFFAFSGDIVKTIPF